MLSRFIIILCSLCLFSCELVVEVEVPNIPPKLVVNSVFKSGDSTWYVSVATTAHILGHTSGTLIAPGAIPILTDETGNQIPLVEHQVSEANFVGTWYQTGGGVVYTASSVAVPGVIYRLEVSAPNFTPVVASTQAPIEIEIVDATLDTEGIIQDDYGSAMVPLTITFNDPAGQRDFYYPRLFHSQRYEYYDPVIEDTVRGVSVQPIYMTKTLGDIDFIEFEEDEDIIDDQAFDGKSFTMHRYARLRGVLLSDKVEAVWVSLGHADESYYRYFRSMTLQRETSGNPLAEPVQVYSNVEGGLGIFTGYTESRWYFIKK